MHTQNERYIVSIPSFQNFPDFDFRIKQKTLSIHPAISPVGRCKDTLFLPNNVTLCKNIISPKVQLFFARTTKFTIKSDFDLD